MPASKARSRLLRKVSALKKRSPHHPVYLTVYGNSRELAAELKRQNAIKVKVIENLSILVRRALQDIENTHLPLLPYDAAAETCRFLTYYALQSSAGFHMLSLAQCLLLSRTL